MIKICLMGKRIKNNSHKQTNKQTNIRNWELLELFPWLFYMSTCKRKEKEMKKKHSRYQKSCFFVIASQVQKLKCLLLGLLDMI